MTEIGPGQRPAPKHPVADVAAFIRANLRLATAPSIPEIRLYTAHPGSGLRRFLEEGPDAPPPYWAYHWAGGAVLARHILDRPQTVAGLRVLDLGAGSGVVGIVAAKAGAAAVMAVDTDPNAAVAIGINAAANGVAISTICGDLTAGPPPAVDLIAVGDLFYERALAVQVEKFLDRCLDAGIAVLVGDPGREHLPRPRLRLVAEYPVRDFGGGSMTTEPSAVFSFEPRCADVPVGALPLPC